VITRDVQELIVSSFAFLIVGMFMGNLILLVLGLFPIIFLAVGLIIGQPAEVEIRREGEDLKVWVDGQVGDTITVSVRGGVGLVTVGDRLPKSFKLDEGSNFRVLWKGLGDLEASLSYRATCAKRGLYQLDSVAWETRHPLGVTQNMLGDYPAPREYIVQPRPLFVRRIRERKALTRVPMPMEARIKFGVPTTDFLEIRDYVSGDSYRMINWKATARMLSASPRPLQVNEYEKEGKKMVWIFLDSASHMALGTTVKNTLEYAIQAALGLTHFYLSRECRVGLCIYDYDAYQWEGSFQRTRPAPDRLPLDSVEQMETPVQAEEVKAAPPGVRSQVRRRIVFPDIGRRQQFRITREMLNIDIGYSDESLKEAIHSCRRHIIGTRPLFIIITMVDAERTRGLLDGVRELNRYSGRLRQRPSILVFNVRGYSVAAQSEEEVMASELLEFHNRPVYATLRRLGATVVTWNPRTQSFAQALIQQGA